MKSENETSGREIIISRVFDSPREVVWEAMTEPAHVVNWWGPRGFTTTILEMDVRPGGAWRHLMHGPDGVDYPNDSIFIEVVKPGRISYRHAGGKKDGPQISSVFIWTFEALEDGKTKATIHMVFPTAEMRETVVREFGAIEGGQQTLERLSEQLAESPVFLERTFAAPVETVWKAITDKEQIKQWYFDMPEFAAEPGREFRFVVEHEGNIYDHRCKVTEVIPGRKLAYTWRYEGHEGHSLVTFELTPEGAGAKLRLTHEGLHTFPKTACFARGNFVQGWTMIIGEGLTKFLAGER